MLHARAALTGPSWPAEKGKMMTETMTGLLKLSGEYGAHNYRPLPVVAAEAEGAWVSDVEGRRYTSTCSPRTRRLTSATGTRG